MSVLERTLICTKRVQCMDGSVQDLRIFRQNGRLFIEEEPAAVALEAIDYEVSRIFGARVLSTEMA